MNAQNAQNPALPAHLLAILSGQGPKLAQSLPPVQSRSAQRAPRSTEERKRPDARDWEEIEAHALDVTGSDSDHLSFHTEI